MWRRFNNNPCGKSVGDCAVRAVSVALGVDWYEAFHLLCDKGLELCDMPSADSVWGAVLRDNGYNRSVIPTGCPDCYSAEDFCRDHPQGVYVLAFGGHVATIRDGCIVDSWNSLQEIPIFYYSRLRRY